MTLEEILKNIPAGGRLQEQALLELYRLKGKEYQWYFIRKGVNPTLVEDVLQETFIKIFKNASSYQGSGGYGEGSAAAWLNKIAFSCMQDHFRSELSKTHGRNDHYQQNEEKIKRDRDLALSRVSEINHDGLSIKNYPYVNVGEVNREATPLLEDIPVDGGDDSTMTQKINECMSGGLDDFAIENPERHMVLMMQLDGVDIKSIAVKIGRQISATKEYLSQCRKKLAPYVEHCAKLMNA